MCIMTGREPTAFYDLYLNLNILVFPSFFFGLCIEVFLSFYDYNLFNHVRCRI